MAHLEEPRRVAPAALSKREQEVLVMMIQGAKNREIALRLNISERTVKAHATSVFNKLGVNSRAEAVAVALKLILIPSRE